MKRVIIISISLILINLILNRWYNDISKEKVIWQLDRAFYEKTLNKYVPYLIIGNSHSFGIKTYENDSLIHFATYGENWLHSYYKLNYLIENDYNIDNVLLNFGLTDTRQVELDNQNLNYWNKYVNFYQAGKLKGQLLKYISFHIRAKYINYAGRYFDFFEYYIKETNPKKKTETEFIPPVTMDTLTNSCEIDKIVSSESIFYLNKIMELCNAQGINLILLKYPITKYHSIEKSKCFSIEEYYQNILSKAEDTQSPLILDYQEIYFDQNFKFMDDHHLKSSYRDEFSAMVRNDLELLLN